jgi:hypothetical protein
VSRFNKVSIWPERFFIRAEFRDVVGLLLGLVSRWDRRRGWCGRKILRGDLYIRYSWLSVDGSLDEGGRSILFDSETGVGLLLQVLVDRTSFVIGGWLPSQRTQRTYSTCPCDGN